MPRRRPARAPIRVEAPNTPGLLSELRAPAKLLRGALTVVTKRLGHWATRAATNYRHGRLCSLSLCSRAGVAWREEQGWRVGLLSALSSSFSNKLQTL